MPSLFSKPPIADISIISVQGRYRRLWHDVCFLFMLNGEIQVEVDGHASYLNDGGIMLAKADIPFTITGHGSNLLMIIRMDYDFFAQGKAGRRLGILVCNSAEDEERDYSMLRQMLSRLALNYFESGANKDLRQMELCYSLLYYLNTTHCKAGSPTSMDGFTSEKRGRQIISYIESNYMRELQLEDLARLSNLSTSYLSRLFKKIAGMNFKSYLQEVRLRHAVEDMRQAGQEEQTVTAIAYNNGFSNASALNSAVRRKYGVSTSELRKTLSLMAPEPAEPASCRAVEYDSVRTSLEILAGSEPAKAMGIYRYPDRLEYHIKDVTKSRAVRPIWKTMINVGNIQSLFNVGIKSQLALVQQEIGFQYARLENILMEEAMPPMADGTYNFSYFDRTVEMLLSLNMTPFLSLALKGDYNLLSMSEIVHRGEAPKRQPDYRVFIDRLSALLRHSINTFGASEVERWGIEISVLHDERLNFLEQPEDYVDRFQAAYRLIKGWLPNILVGGPEYNIATEYSFLEKVMTLFKKEDVTLDFLTVCAIPFMHTIREDGSAQFMVSPNPSYIRDSVQTIRNSMAELLPKSVPIWITTLGPDVRARNYVSDSCYKATFFIKNTIDLIGLADVIGYWQLSDIDTEYIDTHRILFGGTGILSTSGLKKPGFSALKRLSAISTQMVERTGSMLLTTNGINTYHIVLCNHARFTDEYCLTCGEGVTCDNVYTMFSDAAVRDVAVSLNGLRPGRYKVVTTTLNRESGSLFDEWLRYGMIDDLQPQDIHYLRDIVHPHRAVRYQECENGSLELTLQMLPHEIKFLLLIREI